jgi:hypothetical protein
MTHSHRNSKVSRDPKRANSWPPLFPRERAASAFFDSLCRVLEVRRNTPTRAAHFRCGAGFLLRFDGETATWA